MSDSTEALARVLHSTTYPWCRQPDVACRCTTQAERILSDPGPLLAALAEAGVLTEEQAIRMGRKSGEPGPVLAWVGGYRHTTHDDAEPPFTVPVSRYVSEWTALGDDQ